MANFLKIKSFRNILKRKVKYDPLIGYNSDAH